jgi:hypothetical protein
MAEDERLTVIEGVIVESGRSGTIFISLQLGFDVLLEAMRKVAGGRVVITTNGGQEEIEILAACTNVHRDGSIQAEQVRIV